MDRDNVISVQTGTGEHSHSQILERLHRKQYAYKFMKELDKNYKAHTREGVTQGQMNTYGLPGIFFKIISNFDRRRVLCYFNIKSKY